MNWMLWTALAVTCLFMLRFAWHYHQHFEERMGRSLSWDRCHEYLGPPLALSFRYHDMDIGQWRSVAANIVEVVRYGEKTFLKGNELGSNIPRVFRLDGLMDLRERPSQLPVELNELIARMQRLQLATPPKPRVLELPAIYRQA